jgi:Ca2+-binding EF-hand superfamily protein
MHRPTQLAALTCLLLASTALPAQNVPIAQTADDRFDRLDVNHDGVLSRYEVDAEVLLHALDTDGNGSISPAELLPLLGPKATMKTAVDRVRLADRNVNDGLEYDELTRASEIRFGWLDENKDGNVDRQELQSRFGVKMLNGPD